MALVCILKLNTCQATQGCKLIFVPLCNKTEVKKYKKNAEEAEIYFPG